MAVFWRLQPLIFLIIALTPTVRFVSAEDNSSSVFGNGFSVVMFDDVTQLDLIQAALGDPDMADPDTGLSGIFANLTGSVSHICLKDTSTFLTDLLGYEKYALQMRAASAKPIDPVDIEFTHRTTYYGDFELCDGVKVGSYPGASINADPSLMSINVIGLDLKFGVCCPKSCDDTELRIIVMQVIQEFSRKEYVWFSSTDQVPFTWRIGLLFFILLILILMMTIGTVYDLRSRSSNAHEITPTQTESPNVENDSTLIEGAINLGPTSVGALGVEGASEVTRRVRVDRGRSSQALLAFSIATNGPAVLSLKRPRSNMGALDGIRVLSMLWIIWHHVKVLSEGTVDNRRYMNEVVGNRISFRLSSEGHFGVDSFFVLSALLITYHTLCKKRSNGGAISWWRFYLQRYLRLTPVYAFCIVMYVSFSAWLGRGYLNNLTYGEATRKCSQYFWSNLLYINNYVPHPFVLSECLGWSWYLAVDMQMFVATPLYFYFLSSGKEKIGLGIVIGVTVFSVSATMFTAAFLGQPLGNAYQPYNDNYVPGIEMLVYSHVITRVQSYMVGVFCGYLLYKNEGQRVTIPKAWNTLGWFLSINICFVVVFALGFSSYEDPLPAWFAAAWIGCSRFLFSSAVGWIAFACVTGNGGFVGKFLSCEIWLPLSRVSYCVYLFHPVVMVHYLLTSKDQYHWNTYTSVYMFMSFFVASYTVALAVSLLVEVPLLKITKLLLDRKPRND